MGPIEPEFCQHDVNIKKNCIRCIILDCHDFMRNSNVGDDGASAVIEMLIKCEELGTFDATEGIPMLSATNEDNYFCTRYQDFYRKSEIGRMTKSAY